MGSLLLQKLKEKANNPATKDKLFLGVMPKELSYWQADYRTQNNKNDCVNGAMTYKNFYNAIDSFLVEKVRYSYYVQQQKLKENRRLKFYPIFVYRKVHLDTIATFIASMELNLTPVLIFDERSQEVRMADDDLQDYLFSLNDQLDYNADFYIASSGTTNGKPKLLPCYEKDLIKQVENNCKMGLDNFTVYSTLSMTGITGVALNAFLPIIGNCKTIINDKYNLFENISDTKADAFFLPFNYRDYLPLEKGSYDFSHVKCIILSGGYFNSNDINNLLENLPGLKKDVFIHMYSATEFLGVSTFCMYNSLNPIYLNLGSLLDRKVEFSTKENELSIEYMSVGKVNGFQIINEEGKILPEDEIGIISRNGVNVSDLGFIHNGYLYVLGRNQKSDFNNNVLENYFKYKLNREVAIGTYQDQMIPYIGIVGEGLSAYKDQSDEVIRKPINEKELNDIIAANRAGYFDYEGVKESLEFRKPRYIGKNILENLQCREKANEIINLLENELDLEFFGPAILIRFDTNNRLEKKIFNANIFNPFDSANQLNGEDLFNKYYYLIYNYEEIMFTMLMETFNSNQFSKSNVNNSFRTLLEINNFLDILLNNQKLLEKISYNRKVQSIFSAMFVLPSFINIDFQDTHCMDIINYNMSYETLKSFNDCKERLQDDIRYLVRNIISKIYELKSQIGLNIGQELFNYERNIKLNRLLMRSFGQHTLGEYIESVTKEMLDKEENEEILIKKIDKII